MSGMSSKHLTGATAAPATTASYLVRKVSSLLTVEVHGNTWSVAGLQGVQVGDRVLCLPTPDEAQVFVQRETMGAAHGLWAAPVVRDTFGFPVDTPIIGCSLAGVPPSALGTARASDPGAEPSLLGCGARSQAEACLYRSAQPPASGE